LTVVVDEKYAPIAHLGSQRIRARGMRGMEKGFEVARNEAARGRSGFAGGNGRRLTLVVPLIAAIVVAAALSAGATTAGAVTVHDDWTTFMHDRLHSGVSPDSTIGASTATGLAVKWRHTIGPSGADASPAAVYNSTNGLTAYGGSNGGVVHAFNAVTGATFWTRNLGSSVVASPAVDANTLYVATLGGTLYALDATTGTVHCSFTLPTFPPQTGPGQILASPVVGHIDGTGPIVFFGDNGAGTEQNNAGHEWAVTGFGNTAGACMLKWDFNGFTRTGLNGAKTGSWSPPALATDTTGRPLVLFGSSNPDDSVYALDARDGTKVWRFQTGLLNDHDVGAGPTISAPGVNGFADGVVYVNAKDFNLYALDLLTGAHIWTFNFAADSNLKPVSVSTPALVGDELVLGYAVYAYEINATTGLRTWRAAPAAGNILSSPAVSGSSGDLVAFLGNKGGQEVAYRVSDGAQLFVLSIGHSIRASAAVSGGMVFFAGEEGHLYALGAA
jgi:outer membrane protein assembly factor BamB